MLLVKEELQIKKEGINVHQEVNQQNIFFTEKIELKDL